MDTVLWKKRINKYKDLKGNGSSVITLLLPPGEQISKINNMLTTEYGTASNIKSRVTRQSVIDAISSIQSKLKLYRNVPENGLVILCGNVEIDGKEKRLCVDFEPPRKLDKYLYECGSQFNLASLEKLVYDTSIPIGYAIIRGDDFGLYTVKGTEIIEHVKMDIQLPNKHSRGGQSALRFERQTNEKRANYVNKCAEYMNHYLTDKKMPIVIAGPGELKEKLEKEIKSNTRFSHTGSSSTPDVRAYGAGGCTR